MFLKALRGVGQAFKKGGLTASTSLAVKAALSPPFFGALIGTLLANNMDQHVTY